MNRMSSLKWALPMLLLITCAMIPAARTQTAAADIFDARGFNWLFYVNHNADLLGAGITDEAKAKSHWQNFGLNEGRQAHPLFHSKQYFNNYPDLRSFYSATNYRGALSHYLQWGFAEGRHGYAQNGAYGRFTVRNNIISLGTSLRTAGALDSVMFNNKEFINSYDHGRQLQYALSLNDQDEAYNPTEAGTCADDIGVTSRSVLQDISVANDTLTSQTMPAFWRQPGIPCGFLGPTNNTTSLSQYRMNKTVKVGYAGLPNAIQFSFQLLVPENVNKVTLEAPTGYLSGDFSSFYTYQPATSILTAFPADTDNGLQELPLIVATPDGAYAMGCYAPDAPQPSGTTIIYGHFPLKNYVFDAPAKATTKWNIYVRTGAVAAGTTLSFRTFVIVGNLSTVKNTMTQLYRKKQAGTL